MVLLIIFSTLGTIVDSVWATQLNEPVLQEDTEQGEKIELIWKVNSLVKNDSVSEAIVSACMKHTEDYKLCIKNIIWIANSESTLFTKGMNPSNNWFGLMQKTNQGYRKRKFTSIEDSIYYFVNLYESKWREKRTTAEDRMRWKYCTSQCTYRVKNYNSAVTKLALD